ncbi:DinB family protein [Occallatibacter savannae]|uniref:DinB family protein n=1 Tax=Occallatibacter savannae TaxID=1002691 RepID=UPI000D68A963|nr:DinB family protein [Occallatibacter savannae]
MTSLSTLEEQKHELLRELNRWSPVQLAFHPSANEWSALNMLDHLIRTEREILAVIYRNDGQYHRFGMTDRLKNRLLCALFRTGRKVKVPSSARMVLPAEEAEFSALVAEWDEIRTKLDQNLQRLLQSYTGVAVFRHPVAGWMDMPAVLDFLSVHLVHHGFQLARLRNASRHLDPD